jgi:hypothetical protein
MAKDIVVTLENRPGQLASVGEALGGAGVDDMEKARGAV